MESVEDPKQKLEALEAKKRELIDKIRNVNSSMRAKRDDVVKLVPSLRGRAWLHGERTKTAVDSIEFEISTSAYTPAQERLMLKRLKKAQGEMDEALKLEGVRGKVEAARKEMGELAAQRDAIDLELRTVRADLETTYKLILESNAAAYKQMKEKRQDQRREFEHSRRPQHRQQRPDRRKEEMNEMAPYMKQHDDFVSLEEIAEIKKKKE